MNAILVGRKIYALDMQSNFIFTHLVFSMFEDKFGFPERFILCENIFNHPSLGNRKG